MIKCLLLSALRTDRARIYTAFVSLVGAVALLAWTLGLSFTTWHQGKPLANEMMGEIDCWISTARAGGMYNETADYQRLTYGSPYKTIPSEVVMAVKNYSGVASYLTTNVYRCTIDYRPEGRLVQGGGGFSAGLASVGDFATCPYPEGLSEGRWPNPDAEEHECVISPRTFTYHEVDPPPVGSLLVMVTPIGRVDVRVVGYLSAETRPASGFPTLFASKALAQAATFKKAEKGFNLIMCRLNLGADLDELKQIARCASPDDDSANLITRPMLLKQLRSDAINSLKQQVPLLITLACLSAGCMVLNMLCIGINQRRRYFIRMRAIGMSAKQLGNLIRAEAWVMALVAWVFGCIFGWIALWGYVWINGDIFPDGISVTIYTPLLTLVLLCVSVWIGLRYPVRQVMQIHPYDAPETEDRIEDEGRRALLGVLLLIPLILAALPLTYPVMIRGLLLFFVGLPCHFYGLKLILPFLLTLSAKCFSKPLSVCAGVHTVLVSNLFRQHRNLASRMAFTLTVGLGAFIAVHIWGATLTKPFIPTKNFPDAIVSLMPQGVKDGIAAEVQKLPEVKDAFAFTSEQYIVHDDDLAMMQAYHGEVFQQNNVLMLGTDMVRFFGEEWANRQPNLCMITAMMSRHTGLKPGDRFRVIRKRKQGDVVELSLTVGGVVDMNWHLISSRGRLRGRNGTPSGTLGPVFLPIETAHKWDPSHTEGTSFMWVNLAESLEGAELYAYSDRVEAKIQTIADQSRFQKEDKGRDRSASRSACNVQIHLRNEISEGTLIHSDDLVGALAQIPFWSLALLSIGFISMLTATVRMMKNELMIMRAVGMTQSQFFRLLMSQALLTTLCAVLLSLLSGVCVGWSFTALTRASMSFGGLPATLSIPWMNVIEGIIFALVCTLVIAPFPIYYMVKSFTLNKRVD